MALTAVGMAQPTASDTPGPASLAAGGAAPRVDTAHATRLYRLIEDWVTASEAGTVGGATEIRVSGAAGVCVTLRWGGLTVGVGEAGLSPDPVGRGLDSSELLGRPVDLVPLAREATRQALSGLHERVRDAQHRAPVGAGDDQMPTAGLGRAIQVDLQVARTPMVIPLASIEDASELAKSFAAGHHGLRLSRLGREGGPAWLWPANALATNSPAGRQVTQLAKRLGIKPGSADLLSTPGAFLLERFEVIHLVRPKGHEPVATLTRGNRVLPPASISGRTLDRLAERLAEFLVQRQSPSGRFAGTYLPTSDLYDPATATIEEAGLASYALGRRAVVERSRGSQGAEEMTRAASRAIDDLTHRLQTETAHGDEESRVAAIALAVMTLTETPGMNHRKVDRDLLADRLMQMVGGAEEPVALRRPSRALVAAALSSFHEQTGRVESAQLAVQLLDEIWDQTDAGGLVDTLPWLPIAELRLQRLGAPDRLMAERRWKAVSSNLAQLQSALRRLQIAAPPEVGPADVVGGFNLSAGPFPSPDWQSARVLYFLSEGLAQESLVDSAERLDVLLGCGLAARFMAQLIFDEPACFYVRSTADALGGTRVALWDNRVGIGPSSMSLLAVTQLQLSIDGLSRSGAVTDGVAQ